MKQKRLSKKWKKCCIKLVSPFNITVTDLSVKRPKPMPFKAIELVEQNLPDSIQIKKKYLKFELISDDSKKNMEVQCYDIDQYMDLTACINYMFALEKFIGGRTWSQRRKRLRQRVLKQSRTWLQQASLTLSRHLHLGATHLLMTVLTMMMMMMNYGPVPQARSS
ncbi:uncharacterized protein [Ptychodera flava]|uniref:uncharacterized protein n=1 Tax=Ptychodera flava TaxID=63121 RepID=UPI00396A5E2D